ncbi:hypothetical protein [Aminicella lysinilytica]|uniref:YceG-like family protein n=1 Tax=Aminicella lysinilytica TaxID=433323 RepID=A0A4R6PXA9_9FIRM|nr:hypothetical protein [Aminicella lysinilytica]NLD10160.1 hypothetical protein [Clostridiales bacterium]TDP45918.1 hypothetical protein EV211_1608 [Aminicella lysinilytica]
MKKRDFKDFLYDTNDIWLAIAILVIAALIIIWRIDVIMDYPKTLDKSSGTVTTTQEKASTSTDKSSKSDSKTESKTESKSSAETTATLWKDGKLTKDVKVKVASGSVTGAVNSLVDVKLFSSYSDFKKACKAAGAKPSKIKTGTFTFKKGSTKKSIAKQVTK